MSTAVRHVLLDADGVLQTVPGGWYAAMEPYLGDRAREFLHTTWQDELPMLAGQGDYLPVLAQALAAFGVTTSADEVYRDVWHRIETVPASFELVAALRAAGYGVHLGTNQESRRGAYMRDVLGYDALFDVCCYSYELGAAKPDPAFFAAAVRRIGVTPGEVVLVDDTARNVDAARAAGLRAVRWEVSDGHDVLVRELAAHGVTLPGETPPEGALSR